MSEILSLSNLSKRYGFVQALQNLSLVIPEGSVYGILGPNGSGKSTTLGIAMDITIPDSGSVKWFGQSNSAEMRKKIGAIIETPNFYAYLSAYQNLEIVCDIKKINANEIDAVLTKVNLIQRKHSKFKTFSLGMKQRLSIASALLGNPKVLVLDEPTNGLDPEGIAEIRQLIRQLHNEGKTILLASHLLDEVEKVCTHVAVLKSGKLLMAGDVNEILVSEEMIEVSSSDVAKLKNILQTFPSLKNIHTKDLMLHLTFQKPVTTSEINKYCFENGITLTHLSLRKKSLETQFLEMTKSKP